jgi:DNA-binding NarL/FixJ family response regulator
MGIEREQRQIRKVMIVEDEHDILLLYKDYLKTKGHSIIASSTTADDALVDFEKYRPDLVIIDYKLPGLKNGLQAAREIFTKFPSARILIITAYENIKEQLNNDEFFRNKKVGIIIKPVRLARLADMILDM